MCHKVHLTLIFAAGPNFCEYTLGHIGEGIYTIQANVQGYEPVTLTDIESTVDNCERHQTVLLEEELIPAATNCHDGYSFVDNTCKTINGCEFPQLERAILPGVQGANITYECLNACTSMDDSHTIMPAGPSMCESLALP